MAERGECRIFACAVLIFSVMVVTGCRDEPPPKPTNAAAAPKPTASLTRAGHFISAPKIASLPAPPAVPLTEGIPSSLERCCSALEHKAWSTPEPHNEYTEQAAETCERAVKAGQKPEVAIGLIAAALRGAMMPMECKR